ncbi:PD-(D/E)XK nuclease superfamily, partial [Candidatus Kryptonium thompsonii]
DISLDEIDVRRKEYEVQLSIYSYLLSKLCPKQKVFRSYILFTKFPDSPIEITHTNETLVEVEGRIKKFVADIKRMDLDSGVSISSDFKEHCNYCGYFRGGRCIGSEV